MTLKILFALILGFLFSCQDGPKVDSSDDYTAENKWDRNELNFRAQEHLDPSKWDSALLNQDIATYQKYSEVFNGFPLNKSPFPVAQYDYAVFSIPFTLEVEEHVFKGVRIGAYTTPDSDTLVDKLTLLVLTNDRDAEETTLVDSRNYPYLTAQGVFAVSNNEMDWVFSASPDGFSTLLVNMKLFDLRFGETIIIYPQKDQSFRYDQLKDSPNNYENFEKYKSEIAQNRNVKNQLSSDTNIGKGVN